MCKSNTKMVNYGPIMYKEDELTLRKIQTPVTDIWRVGDDLFNKVTDSGTPPVFGNCRTFARLAEPSHYHTPLVGSQHVLWMLQNKKFLSWDGLLQNQDESLRNLDKYIIEIINSNPQAIIYMMQGYGFIDKPRSGDTPVIPKLTATIEHPHLHILTQPIPASHPNYTFVSRGDTGFRRLLETQSDYGMDFINDAIKDELKRFGNPRKMINTLGVSKVNLEVPHSVHGFPDLFTALLASNELMNRESIKKIWPELIIQAANYRLKNNPYNLKIRIAHKLSVMHIIPNAEMRSRLKIESRSDDKILTFVGTNASFSPFADKGYSAVRPDVPLSS